MDQSPCCIQGAFSAFAAGRLQAPQPVRVPADVIADKALHEEIAVIVARLDAQHDEQREAVIDRGPTLRVNRFFYQFGFACLAIALVLSWDSTRL